MLCLGPKKSFLWPRRKLSAQGAVYQCSKVECEAHSAIQVPHPAIWISVENKQTNKHTHIALYVLEDFRIFQQQLFYKFIRDWGHLRAIQIRFSFYGYVLIILSLLNCCSVEALIWKLKINCGGQNLWIRFMLIINKLANGGRATKLKWGW